MTKIIVTCVALVCFLVALWEALASLLFVSVLRFWSVYPWPNRLWMWTVYAIEAPPNAIVHRWLTITGVVVALPLLLIGCSIIALLSKRQSGSSPVYGTTDGATRPQMEANKITTTRRPF